MRKLAGIGAAIVCLAGCGLEPSVPPLPPGPFEPKPLTPSAPRHQPSDRTALLEQLDVARSYWNVEGPIAYELTVSRICLCDRGIPFVSRVTGTTVERSTGGHWRDGRSWGPSLRTVELLFLEARAAALSDADEVEVDFDPRFRYPTRIRIDDWRGAVDDEVEWVAHLQVLRFR